MGIWCGSRYAAQPSPSEGGTSRNVVNEGSLPSSSVPNQVHSMPSRDQKKSTLVIGSHGSWGIILTGTISSGPNQRCHGSGLSHSVTTITGGFVASPVMTNAISCSRGAKSPVLTGCQSSPASGFLDHIAGDPQRSPAEEFLEVFQPTLGVGGVRTLTTSQ